MEYIVNMLKKAVKSWVMAIIVILMLWETLYKLTDAETVSNYFWTGVAICSLNTIIINLRKNKIKNVFYCSASWIVMAGLVLVLYHAGFTAAAVFVAAAIFVSPFLWATLYEGIVGLSLLIVLAMQM